MVKMCVLWGLLYVLKLVYTSIQVYKRPKNPYITNLYNYITIYLYIYSYITIYKGQHLKRWRGF